MTSLLIGMDSHATLVQVSSGLPHYKQWVTLFYKGPKSLYGYVLITLHASFISQFCVFFQNYISTVDSRLTITHRDWQR